MARPSIIEQKLLRIIIRSRITTHEQLDLSVFLAFSFLNKKRLSRRRNKIEGNI